MTSEMGTEKTAGIKIVFLDFDGPIIPKQSHLAKRKEMEKAWPPCVQALNRITRETGAKIVVSSTWRADGLLRTKDRLNSWGVEASVIGLTPHLRTDRGLEIAKFMEDYQRHDIESFVILDDDDDMAHLAHRLIQTPFEIGLTEDDADRAIAMLAAPPVAERKP